MISKNKRPYDASELHPPRRLRANVLDIYSNNLISGRRAQELINDLTEAGASGLESLKQPVGANTMRFLRRSLDKRNLWPKNYMAQIRVIHHKSKAEELQWCAFCLPHEYLHVLATLGDLDILHDNAGLDVVSKLHLEACEGKANHRLVALGVWGDGMPSQWDRGETIEAVSINLPGQSGKWSPMRLPVTAFSRRSVGENTWHDVFGVIAWSLQHAAAGLHPSCRHDGAPWLKSDRARLAQSGKLMLARAAVTGIRGDWAFFGEVFAFPRHSTNSGICWKCRATPSQAPILIDVAITYVYHIAQESSYAGASFAYFGCSTYKHGLVC